MRMRTLAAAARKEASKICEDSGDMTTSKERRLSNANSIRTNKVLYKIYAYLPLLWEAVVAFSGIVSAFVIIYQAAFHAGLLWQWALVYSMDAIYIGYIVYRFFRPFKKRGEVVRDRKKIALNYIRTSFLLDLLSVLPFEVFAVATTHPIYIAAFLRLNRCIRFYKPWTLLCK